MFSITINCNEKKYTYPKGTSLLEISKDFQRNFEDKIIVAKLDGSITELSTKVFNNSQIEFFDRNSSVGNRVYESGLLFVLIKAFKDVNKQEIIISHSMDTGIFIQTIGNITEDLLEKVTNKMNELIKLDLPIDKLLINRKEAIKYYEKLNQQDKVNILKYNTNTNVNLYKLENTYDYFFNNLPISTNYIKEFKLTLIDKNSFVITYPNIYTKKFNTGEKNGKRKHN